MTDNSLARPTGRLAGQQAARVAPSPKPKSGGSRKITRKLVALSSAAVLAVYAVGYLQTEPAAQQIIAQEAAPPAVTGVPATATPLSQIVRSAVAAATATTSSAAPTDTSASSPVAASAPVATPATAPATSTPRPAIPSPRAVASVVRPTASPTPTVAATARYKDGTFVGQGFSRHGDIQATVIVKGGQIVSANVTGCSTRYPCDLVVPLVDEVIQLQGPPVDGISRATDSSMAYYGAVQQALAQAV
jgi:uncharacterized protein with FMN-binding domain